MLFSPYIDEEAGVIMSLGKDKAKKRGDKLGMERVQVYQLRTLARGQKPRNPVEMPKAPAVTAGSSPESRNAGDRQLTDKELRQAQYEKKEAFKDRVYRLMDAPVGIAPTEAKALKMIKSMDEGELAKYEGKAKGKRSLRYTAGVEMAKKRIKDNGDKINSLSDDIRKQEEVISKAQGAKANRAAIKSLKKRSKDNPYGLDSDGMGNSSSKSAQKIRELERANEKLIQQREKLMIQQRNLYSSWGDRIAAKERKDAQQKT